MAQVWSPKFLFFCFFSGATAENVYPSYAFLRNALALRGKKMCPFWAQISYMDDYFLTANFFIFFIMNVCVIIATENRVLII